ncbi:methyl-accepting chemotaxis protein [Alkalihalobacillus deserti]|uniref:methyl-accepting chemotaxis protein n=1 Tax=Alkalihalobacillus deserti TaxID=2879466 RepID=UPI001D1442E8|nr:methyl-accepting chemotaxis protein [Alkalihalobacillus deserti]
MFNLKNLKIRTKLIITTLLLLVIPSVSIGIISYQTSANSLDNAGEIRLQNSVNMTIELIDIMNKEVEKGHLSLEEAQEEVRTMILGPKQAAGTRPINKNINLGENGYIIILDESGTLMAHPNIEGKNTWDTLDKDNEYFTQDIIETAQAGGGFTYYKWPLPNDPNTIADKISYNQLDPNWGWVVSGGSYMQDFNSDANSILKTVVLVLLVSLTIGIVIIFLFAKHISDPLAVVSRQVDEIAKGNLKIDKISLNQKGEIGLLGNNINNMVTVLREMIGKVSESSEHVASSSEQLTASADETSKATDEISESIQFVASSADNQMTSARNAMESASAISNGIEQISSSIQSVNDVASLTKQKSESGQEVIQQTIKQMNVIHTKTNDISEVVNQLGSKSTQIGNIVSLITSVAKQTNLLALNAAIEAARAGEHGKGFAVVADEVRKLAEQASHSASEINHLVGDIQKDIQQSVVTMDEGKHAVRDGITFVDRAGNEFVDITHSVSEVTTQLHEISDGIVQITMQSQSMVTAIEESSNLAENSAGYSQSVAASAEEQNASMEEIAATATILSNMAEELRESVKRFRL